QTARSEAVAKFQPIAENTFDTEIAGERTHDVLQTLAHEDNLAISSHPFFESCDAGRFQLRFQNILEVFLAKEVKAILADAAQQNVKHASSKNAFGRVKQRPNQRQQSHAAAPGPALVEALGVPSEKRHRPHGAEIQQAAFDPPKSAVIGIALRSFVFQGNIH